MRRIFGKASQTLIDSENNIWHKNDPVARRKRFDRINTHWEEILSVINEEVPDIGSVITLMQKTGMPIRLDDIGRNEQDTRDAFVASRDIRNKYLTSSLLWDIGLLETFPIDLYR